jgi:hypothetical protein
MVVATYLAVVALVLVACSVLAALIGKAFKISTADKKQLKERQ